MRRAPRLALTLLSACATTPPAEAPELDPAAALAEAQPAAPRVPDDPDPPTAGPTFVMQTGHAYPIYTLAISPDGRMVASADGVGGLKLWSADDARVTALIRPYPGRAPSSLAAFTPDGARIAIPWGTVVEVRESKTGKLLRRFDVPGDGAHVTFSPDGKTLAISSLDNSITLYDVETMRPIASPAVASSWPVALAFSPDGSKLAAGVYRKPATIFVVDVARGTIAGTLDGHTDAVQSVAWSPDGLRLASSSHDKSIKIWDVDARTLVRTFDGDILGTRLFWRPEGLVSVGSDTKIFDGATFAVATKLVAGASQAALSADGTRLALGDNEGRARVVRVPSGQQISELPHYAAAVQTIAVSPDGSFIVAGSNDGFARIWDARTGTIRAALAGNQNRRVVAVSPDGALVASVGYWEDTTVWESATGKQLAKLPKTSCAELRFSEDGQRLLTSNFWDGSVQLWDARAGKLIASASAGERGGDVAFTADGREVVIIGAKALILWDPSTGAKRTIASEAGSIAWVRADGTFVARDGHAYRVADGKEVDRVVPRMDDTVVAIARGPNGRVAVSTKESRVHVFDSPNAAPKTYRIYGEIGQLAFTPDGQFIALAGDHLRVLRLADGKVLSLEALAKDKRTLALAHTADGLFTGDDEAFESVRFRVGTDLASAELLTAGQMFERFHRPALAVDFFAGRALDGQPAVAELGPAPVVSFAEVLPAKTEADRLRVRVKVVDRGGGIDEVRVFVNGARADEGRGLKSTAKEIVVEAVLAPGDNLITAEAYSVKGRVRSEPARATVRLESAALKKPVLYVLAMTLDQYDDPAMRLAYANADGEAVVKAFEKQKKTLYEDVVVKRLKDKAATKEAVAKAAAELAEKARPGDVLLFYAAGHGTTLRCGQETAARYQLLTYRASLRSEATVCAEALSDSALADMLRKIPAKKKLVVLDTCEAGAAATGEMLVAMRGAEEIDTIKRLARAEGLAVVAAAKAAEYAGEVPALKHGIFSYALLRGLEGAARAGEKEPVTVFNLLAYLQSKVPALSQEHFKRSQYPITSAQGQDFPIALP